MKFTPDTVTGPASSELAKDNRFGLVLSMRRTLNTLACISALPATLACATDQMDSSEIYTDNSEISVENPSDNHEGNTDATTVYAESNVDTIYEIKRPSDPQSLTLYVNAPYNLETGRVSNTEVDVEYSNYDAAPSFNRIHKSFPENPDSNAGIIYMGNGQLSDFDCPDFEHTQMGHLLTGDYRYLEWWEGPLPMQRDGVYCIANYDNSKLFRLRINSVNADSIGIQYQDLGNTGVKTYGCRDNLCDDQTETFCIGCTDADLPFLERAKELQNQTRSCLDNYLGRTIPAPLRQVIYPNSLSVCGGDVCFNSGLATSSVKVWGFQGIVNNGDTRVTELDNLKLDLHENMHVYTTYALPRSLPGWFNEGMSIQTANRVVCSSDQISTGFHIGDNEYEDLRDGVIPYADHHNSPHTKGSLFFKGLEVDYGCGVECAANIWRQLADYNADQFSTNPNAAIKAATDQVVGRDTSALFDLLRITY